MTSIAGDLLGDSATAPPPSAAASDSGGMFAGLDIGTNGHSAPSAAAAAPASLLSELGTPSAAPQSPVDALAGLQGLTPAGEHQRCRYRGDAGICMSDDHLMFRAQTGLPPRVAFTV